jgi:hypothetical protein
MNKNLLAACILFLPNAMQAQDLDGEISDVPDLVAKCDILTVDREKLKNLDRNAAAETIYCSGWYTAVASMLFAMCEMDDISEGETFPPGLKSSAINQTSPIVMHSYVLERLKKEPSLYAAPVTVVVSATLSANFPC